MWESTVAPSETAMYEVWKAELREKIRPPSVERAASVSGAHLQKLDRLRTEKKRISKAFRYRLIHRLSTERDMTKTI